MSCPKSHSENGEGGPLKCALQCYEPTPTHSTTQMNDMLFTSNIVFQKILDFHVNLTHTQVSLLKPSHSVTFDLSFFFFFFLF